MHPDDERLARGSRLLRRRGGLRQRDLVGDGRSIHFVRALEAGRAGTLRVQDVRDHFGRLGAHVRVTGSWNGAELDRLIDARHAALVERGAAILRTYGWQPLTEVTFAEYGERGSIDLYAADERRAAVFVGEAKTAWGSLEETNRRLDAKARLAPTVTFQRFGWRPRSVAKVLILPEESTARRVVARFAVTLSSTYPARAREVRAWLRRPSGQLAGLWFLSDAR